MSFLQYNDYYRQLIRKEPRFSSYIHAAPNLSSDYNCLRDNIEPDYQLFAPDYFHIENPIIYQPSPYQNPSIAMNFVLTRLVSNYLDLAINYDANLLNPWGMIIIDNIIWVANTDSGLITTYDLDGRAFNQIINVFGPGGNILQPTAISSNNNINSFLLFNGPLRSSSTIIIATRNGIISGFNPDVDPVNSIILIDRNSQDSVYTGLVVVNIVPYFPIRNANLSINNLQTLLFATDFFNQKIDVFDGNLDQIDNFNFIDEYSADPIPFDYAPYNIVHIGDFLYVTYAQQMPNNNQYELIGSGKGYVSVFTFSGLFVKRFTSRGVLNAPWGVLLSPSSFAYPAGSIMISNFGDGMINVFDANGIYLSTLTDMSGINICLGSARSLIWERSLYWSSSSDNFRQSFIGSITSFI